MSEPRWRPGQVIVRREVLGLEAGQEPASATAREGVWFGLPVHVVADDEDALVSYIGPGAEFGFVDGQWPTADGRHPWRSQARWQGHGCLMTQRPRDSFAVWHFWHGDDREFLCWYINIQAPFRRTAIGYDTQDYELDVLVFPDGHWELKDLEVLDDRVAAGQLSQHRIDAVRRLGDEMAVQLDAGQHWWDDRWVDWTPDPSWHDADLPPGWAGEEPRV